MRSLREAGCWLAAASCLMGCGVFEFAAFIADGGSPGPTAGDLGTDADCKGNNCWDFSQGNYTNKRLTDEKWTYGNCWSVNTNNLYIDKCTSPIGGDTEIRTPSVKCSILNPKFTLKIRHTIQIAGVNVYAGIYYNDGKADNLLQRARMQDGEYIIPNRSCSAGGDINIILRAEHDAGSGLTTGAWVVQKIEILTP